MGSNVMAKRVQTEAQKEYQKERRRLLQAVRRGEEQGYIYPEDVVPKLPKRVSQKDIEEIRKVKPSDLRKVALRFQKETDSTVKSNVLQTQTRKVKQTRTEISTLKQKTNRPKVTLTAEERHLKAVERGRKAWATRRAKMSDEEYQEYIEIFKRRMKMARDKKKYPSVDYPTISVVDRVQEKVQELERVYFQAIDNVSTNVANLKRETPPWFKIDKRKGHLMEIFQDTINFYGDNLSELENYLISQMDSIDTHLDVIRYDSKSEKVENSFIILGNILNRGSLTPSQAEGLSQMTEYYEDYEEE